LRHLDERLSALPRDLRPVPDTDDHAIDHVLHDRIDCTWQLAKRASREPSPARLVARESSLVDEENAHPCPLEVDRRGRSCRPGTHDEHVEAIHSAIVDARQPADTIARPAGVPEWPKGAGCKPAGSAFGGSNPPPCIARRAGDVSESRSRESLKASASRPRGCEKSVVRGSVH